MDFVCLWPLAGTKTVAENRVIDSSGCERFCPYCVC